MAIETFQRYEKKFLLDTDLFHRVTERISDWMEPDRYNVGGETYSVASIYYDTRQDDLIRRSLEKPLYKEKLRLRAYGVPKPEDKVFLGIKKKYKGVVNKRRTKIRLQDAYSFLETGVLPAYQPFMNRQVMDELAYFRQLYEVYPALYLSYDRYAFFAKDDPEFRVTLDTNITTRREDVRLESGSYGTKLLPPDQWLMEVKVQAAMPLWFVDILSDCGIYPNSFSKYGTEYTQRIQNKEIVYV